MSLERTPRRRKLFLVAGEASGDLYGGQLAEALLQLDPHLEIRGWGGEAMEASGVKISTHYRDLAFMGFWEVLKNLKTIRRNLKRCTEEILSFQPDAFVGIDFPGFNLRVAANVGKAGVFTHHYISPSIWAWNARRIHRIKRTVQRMHVTMPFELAPYEAAHMDVRFVGHPLISLLDQLPDQNLDVKTSLPILALLPLVIGSTSRPKSRRKDLPSHLSVAPWIANTRAEPHASIAGANSTVAATISACHCRCSGTTRLSLSRSYCLGHPRCFQSNSLVDEDCCGGIDHLRHCDP